ncbi:MAG: sigma-54-dependent Fis family transcriptional regulator [Gemmatimonadetes bacterium]|nr:sigma-54-dependent Fis family transcriptional regulator [Gemmatimonadota bacterium]
MSLEKPENSLRLLLIDDEEIIHRSVGRFLENMGYQILHAYSGREGLEVFFEQGADILISDIKMPDMDGIELLDKLNKQAADVEVILITGHGDLTTAIQAMRNGAFDFFNKPVEMEELIASLERTQRYRALRREKDRIQQQLEAFLRSDAGQLRAGEIIGESQGILDLLELVEKVASTERTTVLLQGESGTGKELVARAIHRNSARAEAPFVSINCTAIPDNLFESELFGHEKGAFTDAKGIRKGMFELSDGGVIFLDEIGDMDLAAQAKLLRVLEERCIRRVGGTREIPVDVRLIAATNQHLKQLVEEGKFREDLFFRLNVFPIAVPPLRERGDDVLLLAYHFLRQFAEEIRKNITHIEPEVQEIFKMYSFPGNVRELRNIIERAVILCDGSRLTVREFIDLARSRDETREEPDEEMQFDLGELEERAIRAAMAKVDNNQTDAARLLNIGHDALRYRLKKYGIG